MNYTKAKQLFLSGNINQTEKYFKDNDFILEYAYCRLFSGDLTMAKKLFAQIQKNNMRAEWGIYLLQFINNYIQFLPTYFQVRNFLEIDINLLIKAQCGEYVESIINGADLFYEVNQESYKFIARVMMNNNFPTVAKIFLDKGCDRCYNDPELHFIYGNYHLLNNNTKRAIKEFKVSAEVLPGYYPAKMMLNKLK